MKPFQMENSMTSLISFKRDTKEDGTFAAIF